MVRFVLPQEVGHLLSTAVLQRYGPLVGTVLRSRPYPARIHRVARGLIQTNTPIKIEDLRRTPYSEFVL